MRKRGQRRPIQLMCLVTGITIICSFFGLVNHEIMTPVKLSEKQEANKHSDGGINVGLHRSAFPADGKPEQVKSKRLPDEETPKLISMLQHKLEVLRQHEMMLNMGQQSLCQFGLLRDCIDPNCTLSLPPRLSPENIESIRKPLKEVGMDKLREVIKAFDVTSEKKKYVIVTGASTDHFAETQASLESVHKNVLPHLSNISFYYYDLGLTEEQRKLVQNYAGAELKTFPFDKLPERFRHLKCYLWKPLIVLAHLQTAEYIMWFDASISFSTNIQPYFTNATKTGILLSRNRYSFPQQVYLKMFSYFGDQPCQFSTYRELESGILIFHNEPFIRHLVIEPWSACALDPNCMCPDESRELLKCAHIEKYGKCHRYDQSALGYGLIKLFREDIYSVLLWHKLHDVRRGQKGNYIDNLKTGGEKKYN